MVDDFVPADPDFTSHRSHAQANMEPAAAAYIAAVLIPNLHEGNRQCTLLRILPAGYQTTTNDAESSETATDTRKYDQNARGEPIDTPKTTTITFTEWIPSTLPRTSQKLDASQASFRHSCHFQTAHLTYDTPVKPKSPYHANDEIPTKMQIRKDEMTETFAPIHLESHEYTSSKRCYVTWVKTATLMRVLHTIKNVCT